MMKPIKLTDKEEEIMLLLWQYGPCCVKDLLQYFDEPIPHINTVSSFLRLLEKKGYVGHEPTKNGGFQYFALQPKKDYRRGALGNIVKKYFDNCFSMVSQLVEDEQIDAVQLRELLDMVENKNKKQ